MIVLEALVDSPHAESITPTTALALEAEETAADKTNRIQKGKGAPEPEAKVNVVRMSRVQVAGDVTVPERRRAPQWRGCVS